MRRWIFAALAAVLVQGCAPAPSDRVLPELYEPERATVSRFDAVVRRLEPVIERQCAAARPQGNCDFDFKIDVRATDTPEAFNSRARGTGQPVIALSGPLLATVQGADELAFVLAHEASLHIIDDATRANTRAADAAGFFLGVAAVMTGGDIGDFLITDTVGTLIGLAAVSENAQRKADRAAVELMDQAGYDPAQAAALFRRVPDDAGGFFDLGRNESRARTVERAAASL